MAKRIRVPLTVDIDLADICTSDLVDELKRRGRIFDFRRYEVSDLLEELASRVVQRFGEVNILIMALRDVGCPFELTEPIEKWAAEPVATPLKLREWVNMCSADRGGDGDPDHA